jgi:hypothetical protein
MKTLEMVQSVWKNWQIYERDDALKRFLLVKQQTKIKKFVFRKFSLKKTNFHRVLTMVNDTEIA